MSGKHIGVLYAPGTNCHEETMHALGTIGIDTTLIIISDAGKLSRPLKMFDGLVLPGGFSFGDHFGAGRVLATLIRHGKNGKQRLLDSLREFAEKKKQILGICNGFQALVELGLLPGALLKNTSKRFESRWVAIAPAQRDFWRTNHLKGKRLHLPVAHGEGRFVWSDKDGLVFPVFYYVDNTRNPTMRYPKNPAGSMNAIAGVTDKTGYIMGIMPHPERAYLSNHPSQDGIEILKIFKK